MQTLAQIKAILAQRSLHPKHALGQNFLIDHNLLAKLVDAAAPAPGELVLEVGPGTGTLTETLLDRGCRVVAVELDDALADHLRATLGRRAGFTLVHGDALAPGRRLCPPAVHALGDEPFVLVANLPYQAATPLIMDLLMRRPLCRALAVTVQREVAQRLAAPPGTKAYGTLSVVAQALAAPRLIAKLPPECFWPRPEVTSAMVLLTRLPAPLTATPMALAQLCQRLFSQRRKQIGSTLGRATPLPPSVAPTQRPEELAPAQLVALLGALPPGWLSPRAGGDAEPGTPGGDDLDTADDPR